MLLLTDFEIGSGRSQLSVCAVREKEIRLCWDCGSQKEGSCVGDGGHNKFSLLLSAQISFCVQCRFENGASGRRSDLENRGLGWALQSSEMMMKEWAPLFMDMNPPNDARNHIGIRELGPIVGPEVRLGTVEPPPNRHALRVRTQPSKDVYIGCLSVCHVARPNLCCAVPRTTAFLRAFRLHM